MSWRIGLDVSAVPARPAGAGQYVIELARALGQHVRQSPGAKGALKLVLASRRNDVHRWTAIVPDAEISPQVPSSRALRLAYERFLFGRQLQRSKFGVFHSPHYTMPRGAKVPVVVTIHDLFFFTNASWHIPVKVRVFRDAIRQAVQHAAAIVVPSRHTADELKRLFGNVEAHVIPHGIDHVRFAPRRREEDREALDALDVPRRYVVSVGTTEPRKNLVGLVRAFDRVAESDPDLHLVLAGQPGWGAEELGSAIAQARAASRIHELGYVADDVVPQLYQWADAVAFPAFEEGFGLPALEALACGSPLVTSRGSVMDELTEGCAELIDPHDVADLARGIAAAVSLRPDDSIRNPGGVEVAARYTWKASAEAHLAVYASL